MVTGSPPRLQWADQGVARRACGLAVLALAALWAQTALSQEGLPLPRPGDERPELPGFEKPEPTPGAVLPPLRLPEERGTRGLARGIPVFVRGYEVEGNSVLSPEEIERLTAPYTGREVSFAELAELRDRLTLAYVERGYLTGG